MISFGLQGHITLNLSNLYSIGFICWAIQLRGKTAMKLLVDFRYATGCEKWWISFSITLEPSGHTINGILAEMISRGGCFFFFCVFFMLMQSIIGSVGCSWYCTWLAEGLCQMCFNCFDHCDQVRDVERHYVDGWYTVVYDGEGILDFNMDVTSVHRLTRNHIRIHVNLTTGMNNGIGIRLVDTKEDDPVRQVWSCYQIVSACHIRLMQVWARLWSDVIFFVKKHHQLNSLNISW